MKDLTTSEIERKIEKTKLFFNTQGFKKLWNLFLAISETDDFNEQITKLRSHYLIPKNGFGSYEEMKIWNNLDTDSDNRLKRSLKIANEIKKICDKFKFNFLCSEELIEHYLFYNERNYNKISEAYNLCHIVGLEKKGGLPLNIVEESEVYPITMGISPYASLRDILDYVKKVYKIKIKPLQNKYKEGACKIGKVKTRNKSIQKRNAFIFKNSHKSLKEIRKLLTERNIYLDDGHIGKIISLEKKRRRKV